MFFGKKTSQTFTRENNREIKQDAGVNNDEIRYL